jgi:hypothetical protein
MSKGATEITAMNDLISAVKNYGLVFQSIKVKILFNSEGKCPDEQSSGCQYDEDTIDLRNKRIDNNGCCRRVKYIDERVEFNFLKEFEYFSQEIIGRPAN